MKKILGTAAPRSPQQQNSRKQSAPSQRNNRKKSKGGNDGIEGSEGSDRPMTLVFAGTYYGERDVSTGDVKSYYRFESEQIPGLVLVKDNTQTTGVPWSLRQKMDHPV